MRKRRKLNKGKVIGALILGWLLVSFIGMLFGPVTVKQTPAGNYTEKGFPFCIKVAGGSNEVADYLGVE